MTDLDTRRPTVADRATVRHTIAWALYWVAIIAGVTGIAGLWWP